MSLKFEQCPDCGGRGFNEYQPKCQLCVSLIDTEGHGHPVERTTCATCHGVGTLSGLALAVRKARGGPPPQPVQRGYA
jgi:hypothetical protein